MGTVTAWNGTREDLTRLSVAIEHHCTCARESEHIPAVICQAHRMLTDQRLMNHMAFMATQRLHDADKEQMR